MLKNDKPQQGNVNFGSFQGIGQNDQNQNKQNSTGLFGGIGLQSQTTNNSSLFQPTQNSNQTSGGLFSGLTGGQNKSLLNTGGGTSNQPNTQGELNLGFQNKPQGGGLFNITEPQTQKQVGQTSTGLFGSLGLSGGQNQNPLSGGGGLFSQGQTNPNTSGQGVRFLGGEQKPTGSLFGGLTGLSTQAGSTEQNLPSTLSGGLFSGSAGSTQPSSTQPTTQPLISIVAPTNILGVNLETVSDSVRNAVYSEKSVIDFIKQIEEELDFTDGCLNCSKKKSKPTYNYFLEQERPTIKPNDFYRSMSKRRSYEPKESNFNDFNYYANLPYTVPKRKFATEEKFLQHKRRAPSYYSNLERDFNRNIIEINTKSRLDSSFERKQKLDFDNYNEQVEKNENYSENLYNNYKATSIINNGNTNFTISNLKDTIINNGKKDEKIVQFTITIKDQDIEFNLSANKTNPISLLKELIVEKLKNFHKSNFKILSVENLTLMKKNRFMTDNKKISDYDINNGDNILAIVDHSDEEEEEKDAHISRTEKSSLYDKKSFKTKTLDKNSIINSNEMAPIDMLPVLNKATYKTEPGMNIISRMTVNELKNVPKFSVFNEHGKIQWKDPVNLCELDLDDIIEIGERFIRIYKGHTPKPPIGVGLNKQAILTLYNIIPAEDLKTNEEKEEFIEKLKIICVEQQGKFINYNFISKDLSFSVDNF